MNKKKIANRINFLLNGLKILDKIKKRIRIENKFMYTCILFYKYTNKKIKIDLLFKTQKR